MSANVRHRSGREAAATAYKKALIALSGREARHMAGVRGYVRYLRGECADWRVKARQAERQIELLKIELEEARR